MYKVEENYVHIQIDFSHSNNQAANFLQEKYTLKRYLGYKCTSTSNFH